MSDTEYGRIIDEHYTRVWSKPIDAIRWDKGPIDALPPDFRVLLIRRSTEMVAHATRCMSQPDDRDRLELHALCRPDVVSNVDEILTAVAHYQCTGHALGLNHSVNFGNPWVAGSACSYGLLSLPHFDGPLLEWLEKPRVRFLWLIPVTEAEVSFKKAHGMDALEEAFEGANFDYLDPYRPSVV